MALCFGFNPPGGSARADSSIASHLRNSIPVRIPTWILLVRFLFPGKSLLDGEKREGHPLHFPLTYHFYSIYHLFNAVITGKGRGELGKAQCGSGRGAEAASVSRPVGRSPFVHRMAPEADRFLPRGEGTQGEEKTEGEGVKMESMRVEELENCENCRFSFWAVPEKTLLCRRIPPVSSKNSFESGGSLFSRTHRSVWCEEWRKKGGPAWGGEKGCGPRFGGEYAMRRGA